MYRRSRSKFVLLLAFSLATISADEQPTLQITSLTASPPAIRVGGVPICTTVIVNVTRLGAGSDPYLEIDLAVYTFRGKDTKVAIRSLQPEAAWEGETRGFPFEVCSAAGSGTGNVILKAEITKWSRPWTPKPAPERPVTRPDEANYNIADLLLIDVEP